MPTGCPVSTAHLEHACCQVCPFIAMTARCNCTGPFLPYQVCLISERLQKQCNRPVARRRVQPSLLNLWRVTSCPSLAEQQLTGGGHNEVCFTVPSYVAHGDLGIETHVAYDEVR